MAVSTFKTLVLRGVSVVVRDVVTSGMGLGAVAANAPIPAVPSMRHPSQSCHLADYENLQRSDNQTAQRAGRPGSHPVVPVRRRLAFTAGQTIGTRWLLRLGKPCRTADWRLARFMARPVVRLGTASQKRLLDLGALGLQASKRASVSRPGSTPTGRTLAGSTRG